MHDIRNKQFISLKISRRKKPRTDRGTAIDVLWILPLVCFAVGMAAGPAMADPISTGSGASGELLIAREVSLNGAPASAGLTVLSGSRIRTGLGGRVAVNLGKLGRVTLGPNAEMILTFSERHIGGEILSGWAVVSASRGVMVSTSTADGVAVADGANSSLLIVDVSSGRTRVESSGASVTSEGRKEFVGGGEELEFDRAPHGEIVRRPPNISGSSPETARGGGLSSLLKTGFRGTVEGLTLNHARGLAGDYGSIPVRALNAPNRPDYLRVSSTLQQATTCNEFHEDCAHCAVRPDLVLARPKCLSNFNVSLTNVTVNSVVSVRPFFNNACFTISPAYPQQVPISPGGAYPFTLNASSCPSNAGQLPQNSQIVIQTSACGVHTAQISWGPACK
jgi:hypothetical protein